METRSHSKSTSEGGDEINNSQSFPKNYLEILLANMKESTKRMEQSVQRMK